MIDVSRIRWNEAGLCPAVVVHAITGEALMLGWMNAESLGRTQASGEAWFWSRSRGELWHKGATSGHALAVESIALDCDDDALLVRAVPRGPTCHRGTPACWDGDTGGIVSALDRTMHARRGAEGSYTARLLADEALRTKKIGEESAELIHAALRRDDAALAEEAADLIYHLAAVLHGRGLSLGHALSVLHARHGQPHRGQAL